MLNRRHRFHGYNALRKVYQQGHAVRGPLVNLKLVRRDARRPYRVAVVVSRKVHKSAVKRNRIRRRIYEIVRESDSHINPGTDLVFTVFSEQVADMPVEKLRRAVKNLLLKAAKD